MMKRCRTCKQIIRDGICLSWAMLIVVSAARADNQLKPRVVEVALFKNGLGLVAHEAEVPEPGEYILAHLPVPVHGSVWILPERDAVRVENVVAFSYPHEERRRAVTLPELLKANVGRNGRLKVGDKWIDGKITGMPESEPTLPVPLAEVERRPDQYGYHTFISPSSNSPPGGYSGPPTALVLIESTDGSYGFPQSAISAIATESGQLVDEVVERVPGAALRLTVGGEGGRIRIVSLCWGLTWAPSYLVDLTDSKTATLYCKAEILNDLLDLNDVTIQFITGYPNLAFAGVVSPLALLGTVPDFLGLLSRVGEPGDGRQYHRGVMAQVMMNAPGFAGDRIGGIPSLAPAEGEVREDLFFYPYTGVTLRKSQRGYYPLFTMHTPYQNLYLWEVEDTLDEDEYWRYRDRDRTSDEKQPQVWHVVELTNDGTLPWTTAPAMLTQAGRVLGQDVLPYAAAGAKTRIRVTRAADMGAEVNEQEMERERDALEIHGTHYDRVTVEGRMHVVNHKGKQATLRIKKRLSGKVLKSTPEASVETTAKGLRRANQRQILTWELSLEPAGELDVSYRYEVYIAH